jgi:hypothetical protein
MVSFDEARRIVLARARDNWHAGMGTLVTAPDGFESPKQWRVRAVAKQELDGDDSFIQMDEFVYLVDKNTGVVTVTTYLADQDKIESMVPYRAQ